MWLWIICGILTSSFAAILDTWATSNIVSIETFNSNSFAWFDLLFIICFGDKHPINCLFCRNLAKITQLYKPSIYAGYLKNIYLCNIGIFKIIYIWQQKSFHTIYTTVFVVNWLETLIKSQEAKQNVKLFFALSCNISHWVLMKLISFYCL